MYRPDPPFFIAPPCSTGLFQLPLSAEVGLGTGEGPPLSWTVGSQRGEIGARDSAEQAVVTYDVTLAPACHAAPNVAEMRVAWSGSVALRPDVDNSVPAAELKARSIVKDQPSRLLAYTATNPTLPRVSYDGFAVRRAEVGDGYCYRTEAGSWSVTLRLPAAIYVASEIRPGSCPYRALVAHEQKHIQAVHNVTRTYAERMARALGQLGLPTAERERWARSPEAAETLLTSMVVETVREISAEYRREASRATSAIDTPAEKVAVCAACAERDWPSE